MKTRAKLILFVLLVAACAGLNELYTVAVQPAISTHAAVAQLNGGDGDSVRVHGVQYSPEYLYTVETLLCLVLLIVMFWPVRTSHTKETQNEKQL